MDSKQFLLVFSLVQPINFIILFLVNKKVQEPYMDEYFHLDQTENYLNGKFSYWNDKLTTPPGLYILMLPILKLNSILGFTTTLSMARFLNIFVFGNLSLILSYILYKYNTRERKAIVENHSAIAIAQFFIPTIFFFHFLFYTDSASLISIQLVFILVQAKRINYAAMIGALSIFIRQTNIVWVFFSCCVYLIRKYNLGSGKISRRINVLVQSWRQIVWDFLFMIILGIAFLVFGYLNSGIALGDKLNHTPVFHPTQLLYFLWFICHFLPLNIEEYIFYAIYTLKYIKTHPLSFLLTITIFSVIAHYFTFAHPFILSDNRHYIFYLWKNFFGRFSFFKYAACTLYAFGAFFVFSFLSKNKASSDKILCISILMLCSLIVLTPAGLIEFRYFTVAMTLLNSELRSNMLEGSESKSNCKPENKFKFFKRMFSSHYTNAFIYFIIDLLLFYVYLYRPFDCQGEKNCRFMF